MTLLGFLDYAGVAVFAATGALAASRKQLDLIGFLFFAAATGIGGGTVRDLVLGRTPVFWVINPTYILVCVSVAVLLFFTAHLFESRYRVLIWLDALGLSAYCVMGAAKGLAASGSATVAIVTGILTATFGGVLRDILAGNLPCSCGRKSISPARFWAPPPSLSSIFSAHRFMPHQRRVF